MSVDSDHLGQSGRTLADAGNLLERAAHAVGPASSALGRVAAAVSAVRIGARLLPVAARLVRRYPVGSLLAVAAAAGVLYLMRAAPMPPRPRLGPRLG
ncbi:MAG TPA: hypothetical protein VHE11_10820 [Steroidobacteraceae bacterium]|nr:hypothetical protein [Steroidobacteraceae bacterium]